MILSRCPVASPRGGTQDNTPAETGQDNAEDIANVERPHAVLIVVGHRQNPNALRRSRPARLNDNDHSIQRESQFVHQEGRVRTITDHPARFTRD
jgi:hypothetical protein